MSDPTPTIADLEYAFWKTPPDNGLYPSVPNTAGLPGSPVEGQCVWQADTNQIKIYNGSAWDVVALVGASNLTRVTRPNTTDRLVEVWNGSAWSVLDYNSGLRNIDSLLINSWAPSALPTTLIRIGNRVIFRWYGLEGGSGSFFTPPVGFRPNVDSTLMAANGHTTTGCLIVGSGLVTPYGSASGVQAGVQEVTWNCFDTLPVELPGSNITSAPA